jgi:hypothetical protein
MLNPELAELFRTSQFRIPMNRKRNMVEDRYNLLPTSLLEGFVRRATGKQKSTFLYRKGEKAFETNIINLGIDSGSTHLEDEFASLLDRLRETREHNGILKSGISEFIQHILAQTCHIRNRLRQSPEFLFEKLYEFILDVDNLPILILNNPELIKKHFDRASAYVPALKFYKGILQLQPSALIAFLNKYRAMTEMAMQTFAAKYKTEIIEKLQRNPLKVSPVSELQLQNYQSLQWLICESENSLILGDAGCLFETAGAKRFKPVPDKDDVIKNIFLPISRNQMLIGTSLSSTPQVDYKLLNEITAKCSEKFFVCSENSFEHNRLIPFIGKQSEILSKKELEQFLTEMADESDKWLNIQTK